LDRVSRFASFGQDATALCGGEHPEVQRLFPSQSDALVKMHGRGRMLSAADMSERGAG
jgi:hypothetical protein